MDERKRRSRSVSSRKQVKGKDLLAGEWQVVNSEVQGQREPGSQVLHVR